MLLGNLQLHEPYNHASAWKARNTKIEANSWKLEKLEEAAQKYFFKTLRSSYWEDFRYASEPSSEVKPFNPAKVWKARNTKYETISRKFKKLEETDLNISSKRFNQALEKTINMLLGNRHLHMPYNSVEASKARKTKIKANSWTFEILEEADLHIYFKRFDQAIEKTSIMLLGQVHGYPVFRGGGIFRRGRRRPDASAQLCRSAKNFCRSCQT